MSEKVGANILTIHQEIEEKEGVTDDPILPLLSKLKNFEILKGLTKRQRKVLKSISNRVVYGDGEKIISEGTEANNFFLIRKGSVKIVKDGIQLGKKVVTEHFGVMPLIDGSHRSADVYADATETILFVVPYKRLEEPALKAIYHKIISNQLLDQQSQLRRMNQVTIEEVKEKLNQSILKEEAVKFFISLVVVLLIYEFILGSYLEWGEILKDPIVHQILTPGIIVVLAVMGILHVKNSRYPLEDFGLTWGDWKKDVPESLIWTGIFVAIILGLKFMATLIPGTNYYGQAVFDTSNLLDFDAMTLFIIYAGYTILVPIQEFCARGVMQTGLMRVLDGPYKQLYSILLSSGLFSAFHLFQNMKFALLTFIPGIFWGYMYDRQQSLLGVSISHIIIGLLAITLIGVM